MFHQPFFLVTSTNVTKKISKKLYVHKFVICAIGARNCRIFPNFLFFYRFSAKFWVRALRTSSAKYDSPTYNETFFVSKIILIKCILFLSANEEEKLSEMKDFFFCLCWLLFLLLSYHNHHHHHPKTIRLKYSLDLIRKQMFENKRSFVYISCVSPHSHLEMNVPMETHRDESHWTIESESSEKGRSLNEITYKLGLGCFKVSIKSAMMFDCWLWKPCASKH